MHPKAGRLRLPAFSDAAVFGFVDILYLLLFGLINTYDLITSSTIATDKFSKQDIALVKCADIIGQDV